MSKIKFIFQENQKHQTDAVNSTISLFTGLPQTSSNANIFKRLSPNTEKISDNMKQTSMEGYRDYDIFSNVDQIENNGKISNYFNDIFVNDKLIRNIRKVQNENNLAPDININPDSPTFTIEMETGTGKTYVYLKTILELHKAYKFNKFIIVVPTVAIRLGVMSSIEMLNDHFKTKFNIEIKKHTNVYESKNIKTIRSEFVQKDGLSILVMNIQAFNKKDINKIQIENEWGENLWEDLQYTNPIVIIDEPQKMEGTSDKKSATMKMLNDLKPLFTLKYSATHKKIENQIYKLDSYNSLEQNLVKQISVRTIESELPTDIDYIRYTKFMNNGNAKIKIFHRKQGAIPKLKSFEVSSGSDIYEISGKLEQYKNFFISANPIRGEQLFIDGNNQRIAIEEGGVYNKLEEKNIIRYQIRIAIHNHFEKQFQILKKSKQNKNFKPIKCLTLFFVDEVAKVRNLNNKEDDRGEYLIIFDEEYKHYVNSTNYKENIVKYKNVVKEVENLTRVREGYFSIDGKGRIKEDVKEDGKDDDRDRQIDLILKNKDKLISFDEPLAFIFSHSALREGWDNPNVFTICTLKKGSSDIAKKQEIGRGLRLPVDVGGNRCFDGEVNELTVIANDSYENFSKQLQEDWRSNVGFKERKVSNQILFEVLQNANIPEEYITSENLNIFRKELEIKEVLDKKQNIKDTFSLDNFNFENDFLKQFETEIKQSFTKTINEQINKKIKIKNGDIKHEKNEKTKIVNEKQFKKLFEQLKIRTVYKINFENEKYIKHCGTAINKEMDSFKNKTNLTYKGGKISYKKNGDLNVEEGKVIDSLSNNFEMIYEPKSIYEITSSIMYHTKLPRLAILKIVSQIEDFESLNNQEILDQIIKLLKNKFVEYSAKSFLNSEFEYINSYKVINNFEFDEQDVFGMDIIDNDILHTSKNIFEAKQTNRTSLNKYYKLDSDGEKLFAQYLESNNNVKLFTKLKKGGFKIQTPYGSYTPDWAIVYQEEEKSELYFIAESKYNKEAHNLMTEEQVKINCAKVHFKTISDKLNLDSLKFDWINSEQDFKHKFNVKSSLEV